MKKTIFLIFISLLLIPCFAERKTRVDSYGHQQIKIIWNTNYTLGPDGTNWPKIVGEAVGLKHYDYTYAVIVHVKKDGLWELVSRTDYYDFAYNQAKIEFDEWVNVYEYFVSLN